MRFIVHFVAKGWKKSALAVDIDILQNIQKLADKDDLSSDLPNIEGSEDERKVFFDTLNENGVEFVHYDNLDECLKSLENQTFFLNAEVIIINDGSTDSSSEIMSLRVSCVLYNS